MIETLASLARDAGHAFVPPAESSFASPGGAHLGASMTAKEMQQWFPSRGSADADLLPDLDLLRTRSRDIVRNNGIAGGGLQTLVDNVVGANVRLSAFPDYRALGITPEEADEWARVTESHFRAYWETTEIDAAGQLTGPAMTGQIFRGGMANGESLTLPMWLPMAGSRFGTRFQVIESDRLSNPNDEMDTQQRRGGIEIDSYGRPLAYWIRKTHPGDQYGLTFNLAGEWERIPATTEWGRARVLHQHDKERTGQTRGKPLLASVLAPLRMLDVYHRTEMQAAAVNAFIAAFVETNMDPASVAAMLGSDIESEQFQSYVDQQREFVAPLKGAAILPTMPGSKITPFAPARPAEAFGPFTEAVSRHIGVGMGLPLELLLKDFSKTNYSSARASLLEAYRFFLGRRRWLSDFWLNPMYCLWLEEQVALGAIQAPGFYENRYAWCRAKWIWPGRGWIDPVKEAQAARERIVIGVSTLERECAEQGEDWEEVQDQRAREAAYLEKRGLPPIVPTPPPPVVNTGMGGQEDQ